MKKILYIQIFFLIFLNFQNNLMGQGDTPCTATVITPVASCGYIAGTTVGATYSNNAANYGTPSCASPGAPDVWYTFTATVSGSYTITTTAGSITDGGMQLYSNSTCGGAGYVSIACDDDGGPGLMPQITANLTAGTTYYIRFWRYGSGTGTFNICVQLPVAGPSNDDPCSATPLTVGTSCTFSTYTNAGATASSGVPAPGCANYLGGDVWFSVTVPPSGRLIIDSNTGVMTDGGMAIYSGTCGSLTLIECDDDDSPNGLMPMIDRSGLTPGSTIWIRFWEYGNDNNGTFQICVYDPCGPAPTCNSILGTGVINVSSLPYASGPGTTCGSVDNLTSANAVTCGSTSYFTGEDQVFVFTPTTSGCVNINLTSSGSWTGLMLYEGCPTGTCGVTPGTCIASAQSSSGDKNMTVNVTAGQTYYLVLDSYASPTCNAYSNLTISAPTAAPLNDLPCSATSLTLGVGTGGNNTCASGTGEPTAPACWTTGSVNSVWYSFVAPASGGVTINYSPGTLANAQMELLGGSSCSSLSSIACTGSHSLCQTGLTPGTTYYIRVDGDNDLQGTFTITVSDVASFSCIAGLGTGVTVVSALPYASGAGTTCGAGDDLTSSNTATCGSSSYLGGEDRVWVFTPTTSGCITINLTSSGSWTGLMLYQGCPVGPCGPGTGICVANAQSSSGDKTLNASVIAGQTYYLVLDVFPSPSCNPYSNLTISAPTSSSCASLLGTGVINVPSLPYASGAGTTCGAGNDITSGNAIVCGSSSYYTGEDQVFVFTPTTSGCIDINLTSSGSWTGLMLYEGCPNTCGSPPGTCIANAQNSFGSKSLSANVTAGQTYYLVLDSWATPTCNAYSNLTISAPNPGPYNDAICNAQPLILGVPYYGNNTCSGASGEPSAPTCWTTGTMNTVWYSVIAPISGQLNIRTLVGTLTQTQIQVFSSSTNTCSGVLTSIGCNQSFTNCGITQNSSEIQLTGLTPGNTYFIRVDGRDDLVGSFSIIAVNGTQPYPPIYGQDCSAPFSVCNTNINMGDPGFNGYGLNCDLPYPAGGCPASCLTSGERNIVWYQFQANTGTLLFVINPNLATTDYDWSLYDITGVSNYCTQIANGTLNPIRCSYAAPSGPTGLSLSETDLCEDAGGNRFVQAVTVSGTRTYLLAISNFSGNNTGYNIDFTGTTSLITDPGTFVWTGYVSSDVNLSDNWGGCGVPSCASDAEIFGGPVNQPIITGTFNVRNININPGAMLTVQSGATLNVCGDFTNSGDINFHSNSHTRFIRPTTGLQTISGNLTGVNSLGRVSIDRTGSGTVRIMNDLECTGEFRIENSTNNTFNCNGRNLILRSDFTNVGTAGTFTHGNGRVIFSGTGIQNYQDPGGDLLYNVTVNKPSGEVVLTTVTPSMNITNQLDLTQGLITTNTTQHVHMQNTALGSIINYNASSYVNGRLRRNISAAGGAYVFPVGSTTGGARAGYHPFTLNFISTNATSIVGSYIGAASSYSGGLNECGANYICTYDDIGYWRAEDLGSFTGTYHFDATANSPSMASCGTPSVRTIAKAPTASSTWALEGTACTNGLYRNNLTTFSDFVPVFSTTPFPVEGMLLTATPVNNQIILNWNTNLEINNKGFYVQRSLDAQSFEVIGWVNGAGNSQTPLNYQFIDNQVIKNQRYYYRLEQVDFDGSNKFSNIAEAIISDVQESLVLNIYPNPTNGSAFISMYLIENSIVQVKVYNSLGQNVLNLEQKMQIGEQKMEISTKDLANGIYDLQVHINGKLHNFKLSVIK